MPKMRISVITVCYNSAGTLPATLQSVAAQDWPDVEHIVIDGGSADHTAAVIATQGRHVSCFVSSADNGMYDAMNKGIARATGDVIGLLNADDHYADAHVLSIVARCFEHAQLDAVLGDVSYFRPGNASKIVRRYDSGCFSPAKIGAGWMPAHPAMFLRREVYERFGGYRTDYRIAADFEFVARAFAGGTLRYRHLPEVLVQMQMGGVSTRGWRSNWTITREIMRACRENGIKTSLPRVLTKYFGKLSELITR